MNGPADMPRRLARMLGPAGAEITCEQCFDLLDAYVECELAAGDADLEFAGMRAHLAGCPACAEEHDALRELARADLTS